MNQGMEAPTQTLEEKQASISLDIQFGEALGRLIANPDFKLLFGDEGKFIKDYTMTQLYNLASYDSQSRVMVHEQMIARSVFMNFMDVVIEDHKMAVSDKAEIMAEEK